MSRPSLVVPLVAVLAGCRTQLLDDPVDGGDGVDGGPPGCATHALQRVPIDAIEAVDPLVFSGHLLRVRLTYRRARCDVPGPILDIIDAGMFEGGHTGISLAAFIWASSTACPPVTESVVHVIDTGVPLSPTFAVHERDRATPSLSLSLAPPPPRGCLPVGERFSCTSDCQCQAPDRCIPADARHGLCLRPCAQDADCDGARVPICGPVDRLPSVCQSGGGCAGDGDCRFGQRCGPAPMRSCHPAPHVTGTTCHCQSDCGSGEVCVVGHCRVPCSTSADCPTFFSCGLTADDFAYCVSRS